MFYGGIQIIKGNLTVGEFTIINNYFSSFMNSIKYFLQFGQGYQDFLISLNRVWNIENLVVDNNGSHTLKELKKINVKNISFGYGENMLFENYSYEFNKGNIYCIKGENGVGKSTFIDVLLGLYTKYDGDILYNDINIKELDLYYIRKNKIGYNQQCAYLINDTIFNNLIYGLNSYDKQEMISCINNLNLNSLIEKYEDGINSVINCKNDNISGGEKQKISLIRVLLKNSDLLILDEPTSFLDSISAKKLGDKLINIKSDKIVIVISHDKRLIDIADQVIELKSNN